VVEKRKFPYGMTKIYRRILKEIFDGEATDEQLRKTFDLISDIKDQEFSTYLRCIDADDAIEWIAKAVAIVREGDQT